MSIIRSLGSITAVLVAFTHVACAEPVPNPSAQADRCGPGVSAELENAPCTKADFTQSSVEPYSAADIGFILHFIGTPDECDGTNPASCKHDGRINRSAKH